MPTAVKLSNVKKLSLFKVFFALGILFWVPLAMLKDTLFYVGFRGCNAEGGCWNLQAHYTEMVDGQLVITAKTILLSLGVAAVSGIIYALVTAACIVLAVALYGRIFDFHFHTNDQQ